METRRASQTVDTTLSKRASGHLSRHGRCACGAQALAWYVTRSMLDEHKAGRCELMLNIQPYSTHRRCGPLRTHQHELASRVRTDSSASVTDTRCHRYQQAIARTPHAQARQTCTLPGSPTGQALNELPRQQDTRRASGERVVPSSGRVCKLLSEPKLAPTVPLHGRIWRG